MTTDNLPAIIEPARDVARADTDSWIGVIAEVSRFAAMVAPTDFVPKSLRDSPAATAAAILYGREVGLPPMTALTQTHVIEGKPAMSAEAMRALVLAAGHDIEVTESSGARCVMRGRRRGSERWSGPVEWTIDAARAAGLTNKSNWKAYPRQMLQARTTAELCRLVFPDVIHGFRAVEELDDSGAEETAASPAPTSTTKVARAGRAAAKKSTPAPLEQRPTERPAIAGPPLPGESGFDASLDPRGTASGPPDDGGSPTHEEPSSSTEDGPDAGEDTEKVTETTDTGAVTGDPAPDGGDEPPADAQGEGAEAGGSDTLRGPRKSSRAQHRMIFGLLDGFSIGEDDRHAYVSRIVGRPIGSFNDLTVDNAKAVIDTLGRVRTRVDLDELMAALEDEHGPVTGDAR